MDTTFTIPSVNVLTLSSKIAKLNKRAAKINQPEINMVELETFNKQVYGRGYQNFTHVRIEGDIPKVNGWFLIAAIDHIEGTTIVRNISDDYPVETVYKLGTPFCEHCNTRRIKKYSFIIQNVVSGCQMQVGRTCLQDFLPGDVDKMVSYYSWFSELLDELNNEDGEYYVTGGFDYTFQFTNVLAVAFAMVRKYGYTKSDKMYSTKEQVQEFFADKPGTVDITILDEDSTKADLAIEWLNAQETDNDFILNCQKLCTLEFVEMKYFGYVAGLVAFYENSQKETDVTSEYVGTIKKRENFTVTLVRKTTIESYYGMSYLHTFMDSEKRVLTWFASRDIDLEETVEITVKATVKAHELYRGVKQTKIVRVAVVV